jgi:hypothetical protein
MEGGVDRAGGVVEKISSTGGGGRRRGGRGGGRGGSRVDGSEVTSVASERTAFRARTSSTLLKNEEDENETSSVLGRTSRVNNVEPSRPVWREVSGRTRGSEDSRRFGACLDCRRKSAMVL